MHKYNTPMIIMEHLRIETLISNFKAQEPAICCMKKIYHYLANTHDFFLH